MPSSSLIMEAKGSCSGRAVVSAGHACLAVIQKYCLSDAGMILLEGIINLQKLPDTYLHQMKQAVLHQG